MVLYNSSISNAEISGITVDSTEICNCSFVNTNFITIPEPSYPSIQCVTGSTVQFNNRNVEIKENPIAVRFQMSDGILIIKGGFNNPPFTTDSLADQNNYYISYSNPSLIINSNLTYQKVLSKAANLEQICKGISFFPKGISPRSRAINLLEQTRPEAKAIETLRDEISEEDYRKFLKFGFILVHGQSHRVYQIFRNFSHIKVWENGKKVEEICIYIPDHKIPPTDKLIAFKLMIENDEKSFIKLGNVYRIAS